MKDVSFHIFFIDFFYSYDIMTSKRKVSMSDKFNFDLQVLTDSYKNNRGFTIEKEYDYCRYLCKSSTFFDKFKKEYENFELLNKEYEHSLLAKCKEFVKRDDHGIVSSKLIADNTVDVRFKLTKKEKIKEFTETKLKDSLVNYLEKYFALKKYSDVLNYYKDSQTDNLRSCVYSKFLKNDELFEIELLVENAEKALYIWAGNQKETKPKEMVNQWIDFLKANFPNACLNSYDDAYFENFDKIYLENFDKITEINNYFKNFLSNKDYFTDKSNNIGRQR